MLLHLYKDGGGATWCRMSCRPTGHGSWLMSVSRDMWSINRGLNSFSGARATDGTFSSLG